MHLSLSGSRIKDDREARGLQIHGSSGAIHFQLWRQCPRNELRHPFYSPFLPCDWFVVKWKKACVVPSSNGSRTGSSHSLFNLTINLDSTRRRGKATKCNQWLGKKKKHHELSRDKKKKKLWTMLSYGIHLQEGYHDGSSFSSHLHASGAINNQNCLWDWISLFSLFWPKGPL